LLEMAGLGLGVCCPISALDPEELGSFLNSLGF